MQKARKPSMGEGYSGTRSILVLRPLGGGPRANITIFGLRFRRLGPGRAGMVKRGGLRDVMPRI